MMDVDMGAEAPLSPKVRVNLVAPEGGESNLTLGLDVKPSPMKESPMKETTEQAMESPVPPAPVSAQPAPAAATGKIANYMEQLSDAPAKSHGSPAKSPPAKKAREAGDGFATKLEAFKAFSGEAEPLEEEPSLVDTKKAQYEPKEKKQHKPAPSILERMKMFE